jgi:hypothetical protein
VRGRLLVLLVAALALLILLALGAQSAFAWSAWTHGGASCGSQATSCHPIGGPGTDLAAIDAKCETCHTGATAPVAGQHCWSCHEPGVAPVASPCNGCHLYNESAPASATDYSVAFSHSPHQGSTLEPCTTCHTNMVTDNPHHQAEAAADPTCTDCHKTPQFDNAPVPHGDLGTGASNCATCHLGMTPPAHPSAAQFVKPSFTLAVSDATGGNKTLMVTLKAGATLTPGVAVWLQSAPAAAGPWTVISPNGAVTAADGTYSFTTTSPPATGTAFRAIATGQAGPPVVLPALATQSTAPVATKVTLKLSGLTAGVLKRGKAATATGKVTPLRAGKVTITLQKKKAGKWVKVKAVTRTMSATGTYKWVYRAGTALSARGYYRMHTTTAKTAEYQKGLSVWKNFRVR